MAKVQIEVDVSVVIRHDQQVLLMLRPETDHNFPLHWGIPGGGFETKDESLEATAKREVTEEVGVTIGNLQLLSSNYNSERNVLFVVFSADYMEGELQPDPNEVAEAGWFGPDQLDGKQFTPTTERLVRGVLA